MDSDTLLTAKFLQSETSYPAQSEALSIALLCVLSVEECCDFGKI